MLISERVEESQMGDNLAVLLASGVLEDWKDCLLPTILRSSVGGILFLLHSVLRSGVFRFLFSCQILNIRRDIEVIHQRTKNKFGMVRWHVQKDIPGSTPGLKFFHLVVIKNKKIYIYLVRYYQYMIQIKLIPQRINCSFFIIFFFKE